ncbi:MAG TPA: transglutaminase-like domain-containing protein, partial [Verrucomicrobiae bacterium]|nr:transglutaminase-like domain-containing protein [Verrucomicrobiae bacterium]
MKPPPLLLGATLLFWGWQSGFFIVGAAMAVALESPRFVKARWELADEDFSRIWTFCALVFLAAAVYAFTANEGPSNFGGFFQNPTPRTQSSAGTSSARTAAALFRWLPMIFFPFVAAQMFSTSETIPLTAISLVLRRRRKQAQKLGRPSPAGRNVHIGHPYFAACLLAASVHAAEDGTFFWGLCALLAWALWAQRSRRFAFAVWATTLAAAVALGFYGQRSVTHWQRYLENLNPQWLGRFMRRPGGFDPTQNKTALGNVGDLKTSGAIVIRLEPKNGSRPPTYLRAASYRGYKSQVWFAGSSKDDFETVGESPPESRRWPLLPAKTNTAAVNIACYLDGRGSNSLAGLLPLPGGSGRLENLQAFTLRKNSAGAVLAEGPGLLIFDALYGPGAMIDSAANTNEDLVVGDEASTLDALIDELQFRGKSRAEVLKTLSGFFADKFTYSTWQGRPRGRGTGETPLSRFLQQTRSGHCEYFATATVLLLRRLEIPARYAVGYFVHEASGRKYVVRQRDAHAWC